VRVSSRSGAGTALQAQGLTRDISPGGVRFETDLPQALAPGSEIAVHITIPPHGDSRESSVFISGRATVLRCRPIDAASRRHTGARWSLAARFEAHPDISLPVMEDFTPGVS